MLKYNQMRFDEKPKRRSLHLKKSRAELPREVEHSRLEKPRRGKKGSKLEKLEKEASENLQYEKPEKLPEGYEEEETFLESLKSGAKNHIPLLIGAAVVLIGLGFWTGFFGNLFKGQEPEQTATATTNEETFLVKPKTVFTQGKFDANFENTDAGVDVICETKTDEDGNEKKTCRAKTEEDKKKEQEEKEREEQEKKAEEEREKEKKEEQEAAAKKSEKSSSSKSTDETKSTTKEGPIKAIGITNISGCPAEAVSGSNVTLRASVLPQNAENQNIIWSTTSSASVVYDGTGNTATVSVYEGKKVIVTAMTVDGGYEEHCTFTIVDRLTE